MSDMQYSPHFHVARAMKQRDLHGESIGVKQDDNGYILTEGEGLVGSPKYEIFYEELPEWPDFYDELPEWPEEKPDGGPAAYYDFPEGAITLNDLIEYKDMGFHRGNIFKACWRYGSKEGTTTEYDERKILYSACRMLKKSLGCAKLRSELQRILEDPQFNVP